MSSAASPMAGIGTGTLAERAALAVQGMLHDGVLLPGQPIRQGAVAEQLGMSRVPVREALKSLQAQGLVASSPSGGFEVVRLSAEELSQVYLMRRLLETELLSRVGDVPAGELAALSDLNERMRALLDEPTREWRTLNRELHFRVFGLSGLHHVVAELGRLWDQSEPYRLIYSTEHATRERIVAEHDRLLHALREGDIDGLIQSMDVHRGGTQHDVISVLSRPPGT